MRSARNDPVVCHLDARRALNRLKQNKLKHVFNPLGFKWRRAFKLFRTGSMKTIVLTVCQLYDSAIFLDRIRGRVMIMAVLTEEMKEIISRTEIFPVATASGNGVPNVVPVRYLQVKNDATIWITDNFFAKTLKNLRENPQVSFYIWSPDTKKCFQIKGAVEIQTSGTDYEIMKVKVREKKAELPAKSLVVMTVTEIFDCMPRK